jgi:glycosyltransferase involved in cell wall biosynthesis
MPKVSVIIPTYNRAAFVGKAVESVLNQTFKDYEVIVVDDGSTDDTCSVLAQYRNRIRYLHQKNAGVSAARNTGVKLAASEWIAFLDSDDEWSDRYLAEQLKVASSDVSMLVADCIFRGLKGEESSYFELNGTEREFKNANYVRPPRPFSFLLRYAPWPFCAVMIRREAIVNAGLFDPSMRISEDLDLMVRVALQGAVLVLKSRLTTVYRRIETIESLSAFAKTQPLRSRESDDLLYRKLSAFRALNRYDRHALNRTRSANQRAIGNLLWESGKLEQARNAFRNAVKIHPSFRSFGKYLSSFLRSPPGGRFERLRLLGKKPDSK